MLVNEVNFSNVSLFLLTGLVLISLASVPRFVGLFAGLGADALEDSEAALLRHSNVEAADIGVGHLVKSLLHNRGIFV